MKCFGVFLLAAAATLPLAPGAQGQDKKVSDEQITKLLAGKWIQEEVKKGYLMRVVLTVDKDGTWAAEAKLEIDLPDKKQSLEFISSGTWKVKDGKIEFTFKNSSGPKPKFNPDIETVIEINETTLRTVSEHDKKKETVWTRAKAKS